MTTDKNTEPLDEKSKPSIKSKANKLKKTIIISVSLIVILIALIFIFISPIAKYLIEKYDEKITGRQITIDWAYVNPFTGYVHLDNFRSFEYKSDSVFLAAESVNANFSMRKLFSKTYEITELELVHPIGKIIQTGSKHDLNFMDIIEKFTPDKKGKRKTRKSPVHFSIVKLKITDGIFYYSEDLIPVNYYIKKVNIESTGVHWNEDTIAFKFSFLSGIGGGEMKGNFTVNSKNLDYHFGVVVTKFDLKFLEQYLKDISNYGTFSAFLNADINAKGNFKDKENIIARGMLGIDDFHFGKNPKDDYASMKKIVVTINELSPKFHKYSFDSISLNQPYFKYERYDHFDNIQAVFGKKGAHIDAATANHAKFNLVVEIARYVKVLAKNFFKSNYKINRIAIYKGDFKFNDYSLSEKFGIDLNPIYVVADSITKSKSRVSMSLKSGIKPYGNLSVDLSINPKDSSDFDIIYQLKKIPATMFNPYLINYTEFPLDRGTVELNGKWTVRNGEIQSNNHLVLIDPRLTSRIKNKNTNWIPMRLLMFFVREKGNVIDYQVPITGNLKDPKFHLRDVVFDALTNIVEKPLTAQYRTEVRNIETEIEKTLSLKWEMRKSLLESNQEKFIDKMADFLAENPNEQISIYPKFYEAKEREYILFYEAKKKYYLLRNNKSKKSFNEDDEERVNKMSVKDTLFIQYLDKNVNDPLIFTVQGKCAILLDQSFVDAKLAELKKDRINTFMLELKERKVDKQIKVMKSENVIPYNGFSFYKIDYKNEFPDYLIEAHQKMNELNNEKPRDKFKKQRERNKN